MDDRDDREVVTPARLAAAIAHAREAFPDECCGYLTATALVRCTNVAADPARGYEIAGAELLAFVRGLSGPAPARVIYHSHTNGRAYFSARDAAVAATAAAPIYDVAHLVIGVAPAAPAEAALFAWSASARAYVEVARW